MLNQTSESDVLRLAFGQLNPVVQQVVCDPVNIGVCSCATGFDHLIVCGLLLMIEGATNNPVVFVGAHNLSTEAKGGSSRHKCKLLLRKYERNGYLL